MAGAQYAHQGFEPLQALHQSTQQIGHAQAGADGGRAATHPVDDFFALLDQYQQLLFVLKRRFTTCQIAAVGRGQLMGLNGKC